MYPKCSLQGQEAAGHLDPQPGFTVNANAPLANRLVVFHDEKEGSEEGATRMDTTSQLILDSAGDGIYGLDIDGYVTFINPAAQRMTGWSLEELRGLSQHSMVHHSYPDGSHYPREQCPIYQALRDGRPHHREDEVFWRKDGSSFPVSYTSTPILVESRPIGAVIVFCDITQRVREQVWDKSKAIIFSSIIERRPLRDSLLCVAQALTAYSGGHGVAIHVLEADRLKLMASSGLSIKEQGLAYLACTTKVSAAHAAERGGSREWPFTIPLLTGTGRNVGYLSIFSGEDYEQASIGWALTQAADFVRLAVEHDALQQQLSHQAHHDVLTGLPNRALLQDRLEQAIMSARRRGSRLGICYIDLDRFKLINDTRGHAVGDRYLIRIAGIVKESCREIDTLARQGGDEFVLLLPDLDSSIEAQEVAQRLLDAIRRPFVLDDHSFSPTASVGISVFPEHGEDSGALLQHADTALYAAKRAGRNRVEVFHTDLGKKVREHTWLYNGLECALERHEFQLMYLPILSLTREIQGFEALLRWHHPDGVIGPDRFLPVAEETGIIVPIGAWVLREACKQAKAWQRTGQPAIRLSVNVSGVQLGGNGFVETVTGALRESGLDPRLLQLEIAENYIVGDPKAAAAHLRTLRATGVSISIDGFGTGGSSFGCLHDLPLDTLKIDHSFISRLDGTAKQLSTIRAIVMLAQQLGLHTVAEGVETEEQLRELATINCDFLQGFLFAKPLSAEQASALLA